jgi:hypothetical protein
MSELRSDLSIDEGDGRGLWIATTTGDKWRCVADPTNAKECKEFVRRFNEFLSTVKDDPQEPYHTDLRVHKKKQQRDLLG